MSRYILASGGLIIASQVALAAPASALTPEEVWTQLEGMMQSSGYAAQADVKPWENGLIVKNLTLSFIPPDSSDGAASETITTGDITLVPDSDDPSSVAISLVQPWNFAVDSMEMPDGFSTEGSVAGDNMSLIASGTPDDITYAAAADVTTVSFTSTDASDGQEYATGTVTFSAPASTTRVQEGDLRQVTSKVTAGNIKVDLSVTAPEDDTDTPQPMILNGAMNGITITSAASMPSDASLVSIDDRVAAGMTSDSTVLYDSVQGQMVVEDEDDTITMTVATGGGSIGSTLKDGIFGYDSTTEQIALGMTSKSMPMPIMLNIASTSSALSGPLTETDDARPFSLHFDLTDVALPEMAWAMIDPDNNVPHDPATLSATLSGEGRLLVDLSDPTAIASMPAGKPPVEVNNLDIQEILIQGMGAEVTANGDLEVHNGTQSAFGDFPQVTGTINIAAEGVLGLIQTLAQNGIIDPQQAMMVPMFAGMFAKEVGGPDDLETTIQITPDQAILINGQPLMP